MLAKPLPVHIRWMLRRDMPDVLAIESACFPYPWTEEDFVRCLRQRNCIGMVAEVDQGGFATSTDYGPIAGFAIYELHHGRLHVLSMAVHPRYQRQRVGTQLVRKLISKLSLSRRNKLMLEVRERNLPAQLFFRAMGFKAISLLRDFYEHTTEDAYLFQYRYTDEAAERRGPVTIGGREASAS